MKKTMFALIAVSVLFLVAFGSFTANAVGPEHALIFGRVTYETWDDDGSYHNEALSGATITATVKEEESANTPDTGDVFTTTTWAGGFYVLAVPTGENYVVTVAKENYAAPIPDSITTRVLNHRGFAHCSFIFTEYEPPENDDSKPVGMTAAKLGLLEAKLTR